MKKTIFFLPDKRSLALQEKQKKLWLYTPYLLIAAYTSIIVDRQRGFVFGALL